MKKAFVKRAASPAWIALCLLLLIFPFARVEAQSGDGAVQNPPQADNGQNNANARNMRRRGDPMRALNLTPDQIQQIRAIREESKEEWRAIRQRLAEAHRALDEAIYSDNASEALVEERAREVGLAQATVIRMRSLTELKIRRLLTPEQLNTLRVMRQQARAGERNTDAENGQRRQRRDRFGRRDGAPPQRDNTLNSQDQSPRQRRNEALEGGRRP
ncbi:MAG TPA: Spy/CpxP family protein refolding chaperone [Pyrinomonadaceae bacterium]|jgi:Spy/CpxP family protein refolding chaperone|nr:Spy/CpxP family protein refolding chaperone [Pyrinomonadaceae bacterium]